MFAQDGAAFPGGNANSSARGRPVVWRIAQHPNMTMNEIVRSVRATGAVGVVGVLSPRTRRGRTR